MRLLPAITTCGLLLISATLTSAATAATTSPAEKNTSKLQFKKAADNQTRFVSSKGDLGNGIFANDRRAKAMAFLQSQGAMLGIDNPAQLKFLRDRTDQLGSTTISYKQVINNVPVYGARINANFRSDNSLASVNGDFASGIFINTRPEISRRDAAQIALQQIASGRPSANLQSQSPELYIYRQSLRNNADGPAVLAWRVEVGNGKDVREFVFVNAANGKIVDQHTGIYDVLDRRVYDGGFGGGFLVWSEGDTTPFGSASIDNLIEFTSDSYHFFSNISDGTYLSWDGNSAVMHAVNNEPSISCPNARWNGVSIDFCDGTSSDDVVAHEWAHAYTERTHGLIYRWQSGALNEAYSDIFGEAIDFLNAEGTDAPDNLREVGSCTTLGGSSPPEFSVSSPQAVAGSYSAEGAAFNPLSADISGDLVAAFDGAGVSSTDGCESISNNISGAIAFIDRGECTFVTKVINAQNAGAIGVVIANNAGDGLLNMGGSPAGINIPSVFIGQSDGQSLRNETAVTASIVIGGDSTESVRWLMGEDASSFGGAIRDLWTPTCFGDPGKVSDSQYVCDGNVDGGGVHSNSGIPNHGFALLVDGGTYNGVNVNAIGLTKASNIYWRAATHYQTPTSGFFDHANSLDAACADLIGVPLESVSTEIGGGTPGTVIEQADCDAVTAMADAVELRVAPVQCNFQPLLDQDAPDLCDSGLAVQSVLASDFENGLDGWTPGTRAILNPATFSGPDWSTSSNLPFDRAGTAAYGPNLILGNCSSDIEAGIIYLESPSITLPSGINSPRFSFDHSVMTEALWDGGNIKVSTNGGAFQLVPSSAFIFNAYNSNLNSSDNPMGGEAAFNGSDDGGLISLWGQSQIDLSSFASPGDSIRIRFELGMDGCNGLSGWFVDDVNVYSCEIPAADGDGDGVADNADNCSAVSNPNQVDTDGDGFGNLCDADLDNSNLVNFADLSLLSEAFFADPAAPNWNPHADLNSDGIVNFADLQIMSSLFFLPPGPSGLINN